MSIKFYKLKDFGGFLGNFWPARMFIYGRWWNNVEAPYQAQKTFIKAEQDLIWNAKTPREAYNLGQKVNMKTDWGNIKVSVMRDCCLAKFLQHSDLRKQLMDTGKEELIENSPVDNFWGCGADGNGQNKLGKVLMGIREMLKEE